MKHSEKTSKAIHDLIATCNDAAEGYGKAAKGVRDPELSNWLATASSDREGFAADLSHELQEMGEEARVDLHEGGILHKGWVDLEQSITSKDDIEILRECIAGDSGSLSHYDHALAQELSSDLRSLIVEQRVAVEDRHQTVSNT